jgi:hypothetical protein
MNITKEALEFTKADYSQKLYNTQAGNVTLSAEDRERLQSDYSAKLKATEKELQKYDKG